jgi:glycosyltransferase involved in cell wall biosynthesis
MVRRKSITIVFPAFNEERSILLTLKEYREVFPKAFFVIIDNNSTDKTSLITSRYLSKFDVNGILIKEFNQGKANAFKSAINAFKSDWWILTDADSTYPAADMLKLFKLAKDSSADHGILSRLKTNSYINKNNFKTTIHKFGNNFFSSLINFLSHANFSDCLSGGRVFSLPFIETLVIESTGFELETELNFHSIEIGAKLVEYPCKYRKRKEGDESKLSAFKDGVKIFKFIFNWGIYKKPDILFKISGFLFICIGVVFALRLLNIYISFGEMRYSSSAIAVGIILITGIQFILFGMGITVNRKNYTKLLRLNFLKIKRELI